MSPELTKVVQLEQRGVGARAESLGEGARGEEDGLLDEGKQPLIAAEDAGHGRQCQRHAAQYYAVLQRSAERKRFECANEYGPLRGGGPEMLEHSDCHAPERTGKTASRETEQNVNAAVLWTPYQRGLPEQVCLGGRQVTRKSSSARYGYQR